MNVLWVIVLIFHDFNKPEVTDLLVMTAKNLVEMEIISGVEKGQENASAFFESQSDCEQAIFDLIRHEDAPKGYSLEVNEDGVFARARHFENGSEVISRQIACVSVTGDFLQTPTE